MGDNKKDSDKHASQAFTQTKSGCKRLSAEKDYWLQQFFRRQLRRLHWEWYKLWLQWLALKAGTWMPRAPLSVHLFLRDRSCIWSQLKDIPFQKAKVWKLLKTIHGLIQAPLAFYQLCSKVYTKVGYTQLKSDECVFVCQEDNVKKGSKSAKHRKPIVSLTEMSVIPEEDRVFKDCIHEYVVVFILIYVDNTAVAVTVRHWSDVFMRKSE